jgi:ParB-like chromosome segregation protein Spo0J
MNREYTNSTPNKSSVLRISDIRVGKRFRRDLGNIDDLGESIRNNDLIVPVTIAIDRLLIAGARRIEAFKKLGIEDIPVQVVDIPKHWYTNYINGLVCSSTHKLEAET